MARRRTTKAADDGAVAVAEPPKVDEKLTPEQITEEVAEIKESNKVQALGRIKMMAKSRGYACGKVMREFGYETVAAGITQEMCDRVDELCGKKNSNQSYSWLASAVHNLAGYNGLWDENGEKDEKK